MRELKFSWRGEPVVALDMGKTWQLVRGRDTMIRGPEVVPDEPEEHCTARLRAWLEVKYERQSNPDAD